MNLKAESGTHKPLVVGSNPIAATLFIYTFNSISLRFTNQVFMAEIIDTGYCSTTHYNCFGGRRNTAHINPSRLTDVIIRNASV